MFIALALYAWPFSFLPRGRLGWLGLWHFLGFGANPQAPLRGWILAALVVAVFCAFGMRGYPLIRQHVFDWGAIKAVAIVFAFFSGLMEEVWFRRLVMDYAQSHGQSPGAQIMWSGLIFGGLHAVWALPRGTGAWHSDQ